jgi:hypothetical protein
MPKITTDQDLIDFRKSSGYLDFISWIQNRSESIRGKKIETSVEGCSEVCIPLSQAEGDEREGEGKQSDLLSHRRIIFNIVLSKLAPPVRGLDLS